MPQPSLWLAGLALVWGVLYFGLRAYRIIKARFRAEQRRAEQDLFRAKERLELALDGGNLAEWHLDLANDMLNAGDGWVRFLGHTRSPKLTRGEQILDAVHVEDRDAVKGALVRALKGIEPQMEVEFRIAAHDGEWKWLQARGRVAERDANGRALSVSGTVADIDERKLVPLSPMPANAAEKLSEAEFYDLLAFLLAQRTGKVDRP